MGAGLSDAGSPRAGRARAGLLVLAATLAGCASQHAAFTPSAGAAANAPRGVMKPYEVEGRWYRPQVQPDYDEVGLASWYGDAFHGRPTADGETFDMNRVSAAHATLPLPCLVEVTNLDNGRRLVVRLNDRGPFHTGRIIDLSKAGAKALGFYGRGTARVRVRYVGPAPRRPIEAPTILTARSLTVAPPLPAPSAGAALSTFDEASIASAATPSPASTADEAALEAILPSAAVPPPSAPASSLRAGSWIVQAAAFRNRAGAERTAERLRVAAPVEVEAVGRGERALYRVVMKAFSTYAEALRARDQAVALGFPTAEVRPAG